MDEHGSLRSPRIPAGNELTVVTVTRDRPAQLRRAIDTVRRQDYPYPIEHLIVVDDDTETYRPLADETACDPTGRAAGSAPRTLRWHFEKRRPDDRSGPPVVGRLRNNAVRMAGTPLVAFLDDDNTLERHHFSSLLHCMRRTGCPAVYSQRALVHPDGSPYVTQLSPWRRDISGAAARYAALRRQCVFLPWSNVLRDQVQARGVPERIQMVDTSEWLFTREQAMATPFGETFSQEDWVRVIGEDNKLLARLVEDDVPIASSHMPTLYYVLGGLSNGFSDPSAQQMWQPE